MSMTDQNCSRMEVELSAAIPLTPLLRSGEGRKTARSSLLLRKRLRGEGGGWQLLAPIQ
jgi:hypothetical protein